MDALELAQLTAAARTRDAELGTDRAVELASIDGHRHAALLHQDAAAWQRRAGRIARALLHDEQAKVHTRLANTFDPPADPKEAQPT